jgi:hypothetical protein
MRYLIGIVIAIGLIVVLIILLFSGGKPAAPKVTSLSSYAGSDAVVRLTIDGPVNAPQNHQQVQITVGRDSATFEALQGYDGQVTNTQSYPNTQNSFATFLLALAKAGYLQGNNDPALRDDRGYCPLGERFIFELEQDSNDLTRYWSTSCGSPKTFGGNLNMTLSLFKDQIPDYDTLTANLNNL